MNIPFRVRWAALALGTVTVLVGFASAPHLALAAKASSLGSIAPVSGPIYDMVAGDGNIFYASVPNGILVYKSGPVLIAQYRHTAGSALYHLAYANNRLYYTDQYKNLYIIDVQTPSQPRLLGSVALEYGHYKVTVSGQYAYLVGDNSNVIRVVSVADPTAPTLVNSVTLESEILNIQASGSSLFVTRYPGNLDVLNLTIPSSPTKVVGTVTVPNDPYGMSILDSTLFLANGKQGVTAVDVSTPSAPRVLSTLKMSDYVFSRVSATSTTVFALSSGVLAAIDASDPSDMKVQSTLTMNPGVGGVMVPSLGRFVYLREGYERYTISLIELNSVGLVRTPHRVSTRLQLKKIHVVGDYAYALSEQAGLYTFNVSDPSTPTQEGFANVPANPGSLMDFSTDGNYAYVAAQRFGLRIMSVGVKSNPVAVGSYAKHGLKVWDVALNGKYVYMAAGQSGLIILDVTQPTKPKRVASLALPRDVRVVTIEGNKAYLLGVHHGLYEVDITNPTAPKLVSQSSAVRLVDLQVHGDLAMGYSLTGVTRLYRVAETTFTLLHEAANGHTFGLSYVAPNLYSANGATGVRVFDLTDPQNPLAVDVFRSRGASTYGIDVENGRAYLADKLGLLIYDISGL